MHMYVLRQKQIHWLAFNQLHSSVTICSRTHVFMFYRRRFWASRKKNPQNMLLYHDNKVQLLQYIMLRCYTHTRGDSVQWPRERERDKKSQWHISRNLLLMKQKIFKFNLSSSPCLSLNMNLKCTQISHGVTVDISIFRARYSSPYSWRLSM